MGARLDKLKRMQTAAAQDELPLVRALRRNGIEANRSETVTGLDNRIIGDVQFQIKKAKYSVECQVVGSEKKYDNFSYGEDKVALFRGAGVYKNAYTLLGCYETKGGNDMIYMLFPAKVLHDFFQNLKDEDFGHGIFLNEGPPRKGKAGNKYYTVRPENLASLDGVCIGATIDEVVDQFAKQFQVKCLYCPNMTTTGQPCASCIQDYKDDPDSFK